MKEDFISFSHLIMSLSTSLLMLLQTNLDSNKSNEKNTASVKASDFEHVNAQNEEDVKPDIKSAQLLNDFIEEEAGKSLTNSFALLSIISIY